MKETPLKREILYLSNYYAFAPKSLHVLLGLFLEQADLGSESIVVFDGPLTDIHAREIVSIANYQNNFQFVINPGMVNDQHKKSIEDVVNGSSVLSSTQTSHLELLGNNSKVGAVFLPSEVSFDDSGNVLKHNALLKNLSEANERYYGSNIVVFSYAPPKFDTRQLNVRAVDSFWSGVVYEPFNYEGLFLPKDVGIFDYDLVEHLNEKKAKIKTLRDNIGDEGLRNLLSQYGVSKVVSSGMGSFPGAAHKIDFKDRVKGYDRTQELFLYGSNLNRLLKPFDLSAMASKMTVFPTGEVSYELLYVSREDFFSLIEKYNGQPRIVYNYN